MTVKVHQPLFLCLNGLLRSLFKAILLVHIKQDNVDPKQIELGYSVMSEEHLPNHLAKYAQLAEKAGFSFATISNHYHPWLDIEGQSPFVWTTLGAIAQATKNIRVGTPLLAPQCVFTQQL